MVTSVFIVFLLFCSLFSRFFSCMCIFVLLSMVNKQYNTNSPRYLNTEHNRVAGYYYSSFLATLKLTLEY